MPPASPVPGWASGEVCTDNTATRRGAARPATSGHGAARPATSGHGPAGPFSSVTRRTKPSLHRGYPGYLRPEGLGPPHRTDRVGVEPAQRYRASTRFLHAV